MSTTTDNTQVNGAIHLGDNIWATPNADGVSYTVSGSDDPEYNGVWFPSDSSNPDAVKMEAPGTQFDGTWWVKQ